MVYCCGKEDKTKNVTLTFKRAELIYDASNYSFVEADIMPAGYGHRPTVST